MSVVELPSDIPADVPGLWEGYASWLGSKGVSRPRVAIHGGYGKNNLGDDAILDVLLTRTLAHFPDAEVTVVCHGPRNVKARYRELSNLSACHFKSFDALRAVAASHVYFIGGGGVVNRINAYSGRQRLRLLDMKGKYLFLAALGAKMCGARTHFYAIGVNSFPDAGVRLLARLGLRRADVVSVRDRMSLANLRALGLTRDIPLVLDPAVSLKPGTREEAERMLARWNATRRGRPRVCIGFRYVRERSISNDEKVDRVAELAQHLMQSGFQVVFLAASQHPSEHFEDDLHFGRAVRARLGDTEAFALIEEYCHPSLTMAALGCMDFCVLERLHAVILASLTGVPVFVISYDDKVTEFVKLIRRERSLMQLGEFLQQRSFGWLDAHLDGVRVPREAS
jgi:polysaccharide pyruvyl transferase WcaK-like protein